MTRLVAGDLIKTLLSGASSLVASGSLATTPETKCVLVAWQIHAIVLAMFASIIAPFGGFFASGFKRSFKIKDFGDSIPGHGGMTDRMDCQVGPCHESCPASSAPVLPHSWTCSAKGP